MRDETIVNVEQELPFKHEKRKHLQGLRGMAIISVIGFHFYPSFFPNGYLGVDQFFVLSGYLMCMLLERSRSQSSVSLVLQFYLKRFKRILPLYFLVISCSLIFLYTMFPDTAVETNVSSASKALMFVSNRPKTDQENYFYMLQIGMDIFTHTWSLSVEVQFYFLVPFVFLIINLFPVKYQLLNYALIGVLSLCFSMKSSEIVSFNSVYARIWQFTVGMIVYSVELSNESSSSKVKLLGESNEMKLIEKKMLLSHDGFDETEPSKMNLTESSENTTTLGETRESTWIATVIHTSKLFLIITMAYIVAYPFMAPTGFVRIYFTIATGLLILVSHADELLSNKILAYIGDISYSLYLIHWPIYSYWKLTLDNNQHALVMCLVFSLMTAVLIFEFYEKWYLTLSSTDTGVLVFCLILSSVLLINKDRVISNFGCSDQEVNFKVFDGVTENMTVADAAVMNAKWTAEDGRNIMSATCEYENVGPHGWCKHTGLNSNGKNKIMIFGNSWTANHANMFYQECYHKANSILQGAAYGCEPLYPSTLSQMCKDNFTDFAVRIEKFNPDYAFMFTRHISVGDPFQYNVTSFDDDPVYQTMKKQVLILIKSVKKKLYVLDAVPRVRNVPNIARLMKANIKLEKIDENIIDMASYDMARRRYAKLFEDCGEKCVQIDYVPEFFNNSSKTFRYYDNQGFSYFTGANHLTPHGIEHVRHLYSNICKKI